MAVKDLITRKKAGRDVPFIPLQDYPFMDLRRDIEQLFDDFSRGFGIERFSPALRERTFNPRVDVSETDKEIRVTAELPGLQEKEIELSITDDSLTIKGEKKEEKEEKEEQKGYYRMERTYGSFTRVIALPSEVQTDKAKASFKNGVLSIEMPKKPEATSNKRTIPITS